MECTVKPSTTICHHNKVIRIRDNIKDSRCEVLLLKVHTTMMVLNKEVLLLKAVGTTTVLSSDLQSHLLEDAGDLNLWVTPNLALPTTRVRAALKVATIVKAVLLKVATMVTKVLKVETMVTRVLLKTTIATVVNEVTRQSRPDQLDQLPLGLATNTIKSTVNLS